MLKQLKKINLLLNKRHKKSLVLLALLLFIGIFLEMISLALIVPLAKMISDPEYMINNSLLEFFRKHIIDISSLLFFKYFLIGIVLTFVFKTLFLVFLTVKQFKLIANINSYLSSNFLKRYMNQEYSYYLDRNSNTAIKIIQIEIPILMRFIFSLLVLTIEVGLTIAVIFTLFYIQPIGTLILSFFLFITSNLFFHITKKKLHQWGKKKIFNSKYSFKK